MKMWYFVGEDTPNHLNNDANFSMATSCSFLVTGQAQEVELTYALFKSDAVALIGMAQDQQGYIRMVDNGNGLIKYGVGIELKPR